MVAKVKPLPNNSWQGKATVLAAELAAEAKSGGPVEPDPLAEINSVLADQSAQLAQGRLPQARISLRILLLKALYTDQMVWRGWGSFPFFLVIISLVQVVMFVHYAVTNDLQVTWSAPLAGDPDMFMRMRRDWPDCGDTRPEVWRLVSYQLVHKGVGHLLSNLLLQLLFGIPLEIVHQSWRILIAYEVGVLMGGLAHGYSDVQRVLVGCSGGVYTLLGLRSADLALNWANMSFRQHLWCISGQQQPHKGGAQSISLSAHYGGWMVGFWAGLLLLKNLTLEKYERPLRIAAGVILSACLVLGVVWYAVVWPPQALWEQAFRLDNHACCWLDVPGGTVRQDHYCLADRGGVPTLYARSDYCWRDDNLYHGACVGGHSNTTQDQEGTLVPGSFVWAGVGMSTAG